MHAYYSFPWLLAGAFSFMAFLGYSQNRILTQVDSLTTLLEELEPSRDKCEVYYRLYGLYLYQDTEKAESYLEQGYALAKALEDRRSLILAHDKYGGLAMVRSNFR